MNPDADSPARLEFLDIQEVVNEIRQRTRRLVPRGTLESGDTARFGRGMTGAPPSPPPAFGLAKSDEFHSLIASGRLLAGAMPEQPPTLRGTVGRWLVAIVRRMLFWYIPQVQSFQQGAAQAVKELAEGLRAMHRYQSQWHCTFAGLIEEIRSVRTQLNIIEVCSYESRDLSLNHRTQLDNTQQSRYAFKETAVDQLEESAVFSNRVAGMLREIQQLRAVLQNQDQTFQDWTKSTGTDEWDDPANEAHPRLTCALREAAKTTQQIKTLLQIQESKVSLLLEELGRLPKPPHSERS